MGMALITVVARILEGMFVVGGAGSIVVLILSGIEDLQTLFGEDEHS
jgi:hypothetical protein